MAKWIDVGAETDFPKGTKHCLSAAGIPVVLCNVAGELFATVNICPHAGLPLGEGDLAGKILTCPFHGFTYNVETGKNVDMPDDLPLTTFAVKVEGGRVRVEVPVQAQ